MLAVRRRRFGQRLERRQITPYPIGIALECCFLHQGKAKQRQLHFCPFAVGDDAQRHIDLLPDLRPIFQLDQ